LTPIHSLAQHMDAIVKEGDFSAADREDLLLASQTIVNRSNHLQEFVERYRKLTMLPTPLKTNAQMEALLEQSIAQMQVLFKAADIQLVKHFENTEAIAVDVIQFEQVMINILTNSYHAIKATQNAQIELRLSQEKHKIFLDILDSGALIDAAIISKIFLPFYTTRKDGAGIGLTLSKTIIEAHGGHLIYMQLEDKNCFRIILPLT